MFLPKFY